MAIEEEKDNEHVENKNRQIAFILPDSKQELLSIYNDKRRDKNIRLKALRKLLFIDPSMSKQLGGDIVKLAQQAAVNTMNGHNEEMTIVWMSSMEDEKRKLIGNDQDPVLIMLADRVVMCWFKMQGAEWRNANDDQERTMKQAQFLAEEVKMCQSNYMNAISSFYRYREERNRLRGQITNIDAK